MLSQQQGKETFFVPEGTKEIDAFCFYGSSAKKVQISKNVEIIANYAFTYSTNYHEITFAADSKL